MTMYNLLHGENPDNDMLLAAVGLTAGQVGRFRNAWITEQGEIAIYTRNGGGNRECWREYDAEPLDIPCDCPGCIISYRLPAHPLYLRDADDEFDSTYATIYFRAPDSIPDDYPRGKSGDEQWAAMFQRLGLLEADDE